MNELERQLNESNKLFLAGYSKGYADGIKYTLDAMDRALVKHPPIDLEAALSRTEYLEDR